MSPAGFLQGFRAMAPLWFGVAPFGLVYAVTARSAGLGLVDTQLMSLAVFAGSAQFSAAGLFALGAGPLTLVLTTFVINLRHLLYSLTLGQRLTLSWPQRLVAAQFLTDEAFGVVYASGRRDLGFLLGAEFSLFLVWNLTTLLGNLLSSAVPDPEALGVDFIFPLTFLALLIPLLRRPVDLTVAAIAAAGTLVLDRFLGSSPTIPLVGVTGALLGAWLTRHPGGRGSG